MLLEWENLSSSANCLLSSLSKYCFSSAVQQMLRMLYVLYCNINSEKAAWKNKVRTCMHLYIYIERERERKNWPITFQVACLRTCVLFLLAPPLRLDHTLRASCHPMLGSGRKYGMVPEYINKFLWFRRTVILCIYASSSRACVRWTRNSALLYTGCRTGSEAWRQDELAGIVDECTALLGELCCVARIACAIPMATISSKWLQSRMAAHTSQPLFPVLCSFFCSLLPLTFSSSLKHFLPYCLSTGIRCASHDAYNRRTVGKESAMEKQAGKVAWQLQLPCGYRHTSLQGLQPYNVL